MLLAIFHYHRLEEGPLESYEHASDERGGGGYSETLKTQQLQHSILQSKDNLLIALMVDPFFSDCCR